MELNLGGRAALVTGGSQGIGRACAIALAAEGVRVAVCARNGDALAALVEELGGTVAGHRALAVDLMDDAGPRTLLDWLASEFAPVEIVVHNVGGTLGVRDPLSSIADWRRVMRFNLDIAIELNAGLIPPMVERRAGRVIIISSLAGFEHQGAVPYSVAKAALTAYVRGAGRTYAPDGVVICGVVPGVILSEGGPWYEASQRDPDYVAAYIKERIPRGRFGAPEEVAAAVTFLASDHAAPFVGSIIPLEGGQGRSFFGQ
jgi:3-oxoacyl-[acyl-carrier protein] reductase